LENRGDGVGSFCSSLAGTIATAFGLLALIAGPLTEVRAAPPHTAPGGDLNLDGMVDVVDLQCLVLVFTQAEAAASLGLDACNSDDDCVAQVGVGYRCDAGFGGQMLCLPSCLSPSVALAAEEVDCPDPEADTIHCMGLVPRSIVDLNCDLAISSQDFIFLVAVILDKPGGPGSADIDMDGLLNFCDPDTDDDGVLDLADTCPMDVDPLQLDSDGDLLGDACDLDDDGDGDPDATDCDPLSPLVANGLPEVCDGTDNNCDGVIDEDFVDTDADGLADCVDNDSDGDGDPDLTDCEPLDENVHHGALDLCDNGVDDDCDGISVDVCSSTSCLAILQANPDATSGVYYVSPATGSPFKTWCDMETDGGGWTYGAIVTSVSSTEDRTILLGHTKMGATHPNKEQNVFSVNLTGVVFNQVRIDNFTKGAAVVRPTASPQTWDESTYKSSYNFPAKAVPLASGWELRMGYYSDWCILSYTNIPVCFARSNKPKSVVCDTDWGLGEGWLDGTGGEICNKYYCKKVWRDNSSCNSYLSYMAVYGFAVK